MKSKMTWYFAALWLISVSVQVVLASQNQGFVGDIMIFAAWMREIQQYGLAGIYQFAQVDYPPIYLLVLGWYGGLANIIHLNLTAGALWIKLPGIVVDAFAMIAFFFASRGVQPQWRAFILALFCLNPAILFDTSVWGQIDILDGSLAFLAIMTARKRRGLAGGIFSLALLSKFQAIVIFPVLVAHVARALLVTRQTRPVLRFVAGLAIPLLLIGSYLLLHGALYDMVDKAYVVTTGEYPYVDMNAMNVWYYLFDVSPNLADSTIIFAGLGFKVVGLALLSVATLYVIIYTVYNRQDTTAVLLKAATIISFSFYMLPTEIHERYIIMAVIFAVAVALLDRRWSLLASGLTLTAFFNLVAVYFSVVNPTSDMWMVYLNVVMLIAMFVLTSKEIALPSLWKGVLARGQVNG